MIEIVAIKVLLWFLSLSGLILVGGKLMGQVANTGHLRWAYVVGGVFAVAIVAHVASFLAGYVFTTALKPIAEPSQAFSLTTLIHGVGVLVWASLARDARNFKTSAIRFIARVACAAFLTFLIGNWMLSVGSIAEKLMA